MQEPKGYPQSVAEKSNRRTTHIGERNMQTARDRTKSKCRAAAPSKKIGCVFIVARTSVRNGNYLQPTIA
eukprot:6211733-Pleurochrysis_carterae.AAC.3